jgi:uncharacterized membrane protein YdjX (TVP38/TMEM64 family)
MSAMPKSMESQAVPAAEAAPSAPALSLPWRKIILLGVAVAGLLAVVYFSPLRSYLGRVREVSDSIRGLGLLGPLVLCGSVAVLVAVGFPRLLFCVIAGTALGFWSGLLWTQLGTLVGNYAVFLLVRWHGRGWAERYLSKRGRLHSLIRQEGVTGVILARQVPVPGLLINLACGLLSLRHRDFLVGTLIGQLPAAIPCTLIGAGVLGASFGKSVGLIGLAVLVALLAWMGLRMVLRRTPTEPSA